MKRKLQVILTEDSWAMLEAMEKKANEGFANGSINYSDVVNEMILTSKIDLKALQIKHINIRKSLRLMATQKDIDLDLAIRTLTELKAKGGKKNQKTQLSMDGAE